MTLALSVTGCTTSGSGQADKEQKQAQERVNESERLRLTTELATLDHVTYTSVGYNGTWPEKGRVSISLNVPLQFKSGTNVYYEAATKAVWLSKIKPLDTITVLVAFDDGSHSTIAPLLNKQGIPELTQRYGPRPT